MYKKKVCLNDSIIIIITIKTRHFELMFDLFLFSHFQYIIFTKKNHLISHYVSYFGILKNRKYDFFFDGYDFFLMKE
jgi:hypothetical protein